MKFVFKQAVMSGEEVVTPAITLNYGNFIQVVIDFLIIGDPSSLLLKE